jgi:hypothetical protein
MSEEGTAVDGHSEKNFERWNHEEKEYIKQDNFLCENHLLENVDR